METKRIKYPIGVQTFRDIVEGGYIYIDKTGFVHDLDENYKYVFLSRPRKFGKSLLSPRSIVTLRERRICSTG